MSAPDKIYLQWFDENGNELKEGDDEITWCSDSIEETDVAYVRCDKLARYEAIEKVLRDIEYINIGEENDKMCPRCGNATHRPDCALAAALKEG